MSASPASAYNGLDRNNPIEIIMAREAGRISIGWTVPNVAQTTWCSALRP